MLKPCPFCGLPATACCPCFDVIHDGSDMDLYNHRPIEDALRAEIAELRHHLATCLDEWGKLQQFVADTSASLKGVRRG
jgi:hypothetical protein